MGRFVSVEEVCQAVIHLTSQHSKMITGQCIAVDGGKSKTIRG
jgi:enoyl-[acyl-carrier-protein] reductase (NADH)